MSVCHVLWLAFLVLPGQAGGKIGAIGGVVLDSNRQPVPGAEVVLRVSFGGPFVPLSQTPAGPDGRFLFKRLEVGPAAVYLPGANHQGIHYPGRRIRLAADDPVAAVELTVRDALTGPSPLVARRHEIVLRAESGQLRVREIILIENPSPATYVGPAAEEGQEPVTFQLAIPPDFERVTFDQEFFGRRFAIAGGRLVTGIPWTPGSRQLGFTYVLRNDKGTRLWQRPLDLPTSDLEIRVETDQPEEVSCNLPRQGAGGGGSIIFASQGETLPAGYVIRVGLGQLPLPFFAYARWLAALALVAGVTAVSLLLARRRRRTRPGTSRRPPGKVPAPSFPPGPHPHGGKAPQRRARRFRHGPG